MKIRKTTTVTDAPAPRWQARLDRRLGIFRWMAEGTFTEGLPPHWEARLHRRLGIFGWTAEGWYCGPDVPYPGVAEDIVAGFGGWTLREARDQAAIWIKATDQEPHEDWLPLRDPDDGEALQEARTA